MLRGTRGLLLLAIVLIAGAVGATYFAQRRTLARQAPPRPQPLPTNTDAAAQSWVWRKDEATHGIVEVRAKRFRRLTDPGLVEIEEVEVIVYKNGGREYDHIRSAKAQFDEGQGTLYSDGEVDIALGVPAEGPPRGRQLEVRTSGVTYEARTGRMRTERAASFSFDQGDGRAVGASYDPLVRDLVLKSQVEVHWRGRDAASQPMTIETGELIYKERDAVVLLNGWSRLTRGTTTLEGGQAVIKLKDRAIDQVEVQQPRGTDRQPGRELEYSADHLLMELNSDGEIRRILADPNARLVSVTDTARTTIGTQWVEMLFDTASGGSELRQALARGGAALQSTPVPRRGVLTPETRLLKSETILLKMRPGGRDIEMVETQAPGRLEFLPNRPEQRHRTLDAERMSVVYGPENVVRSFSATGAATRTDPEPPPASGQRERTAGAPVLTWSRDLKAEFDPATGQLARMEQWNDFRYQEGERQARAHRGVLEEARNLITLEQGARVWDAAGTTSADRILLDQRSGDVTAEGNVFSSRLPDGQGRSSAMLSGDQPLEATAERMRTTERNRKIHYEGQAMAWQGANRIRADSIDIDREQRVLTAHGHVRTRFLDRQKDPTKQTAAGAPAAAPAFVSIDAAALLYTESSRTAHYTGGVHLTRPGMDVKAAELRAWLNDANATSSLDHAFADGKVVVVRATPGRTLRGAGEHAEYYTAEERILLTGDNATLVDSARGLTKGRELTYYVNLDKLLVNGRPEQPVTSRILRR